MLTVYTRHPEGVMATTVPPGEPFAPETIWIDLLEPTADEEAHVEAYLNIDVPTLEEMREIEPSSRLYEEDGTIFMTASVLYKADTHEPETRAITFILTEQHLVTVRYSSPMPFETFPARIAGHPELCASPSLALTNLLDAIVDRIADTLEMVDATVGSLSRAIFSPLGSAAAATADYSDELRTIGLNAVRCSRVDESLVTLSRLLTFFDARLRTVGHKDTRSRVKDLTRDILSLSGYVERLSEKLELMLNATLGMINIQQTGIIKIFSVLAVVLLPPTLIASIYGMNFEHMPELAWTYGYPLTLMLMVASAILPYWFFKRKRWL